MAKAEAFKKVFDSDVKAGASFEEVSRYLKAHNLHFGPFGLTNPQDNPPTDGYGLLEASRCSARRARTGIAAKGSVGLGLVRQ
jgi:hypothetical protein